MYILGISCFYHDSAACLLKNGEIIAAAAEERFTRKKHDSSFPSLAIEYCLSEANIKGSDLDYIAFYEKPFLKFERILETYLATTPFSIKPFLKAVPAWIKQKLWIKSIIRKKLGYTGKIFFPEHHESHAASSYYMSPFDEAAILTLDGVGEWTTTTLGLGKDNKIKIVKEIQFPHSLGLLYTAFTYYLGFKVNSGEYKVMGAAPYGKPEYRDLIMDNLIDLKEDGSFRLNMDYFAYTYDLKMINGRFEKLFGLPPRVPETPLDQKHFNIAASIQKVLEETVLKMTNYLYQETHLDNLCLAGGVALNCVANSRILRETPFKNIFVFPAAGDDGGAVGAAVSVYYNYLGNQERKPLAHAYLGPSFSNVQIKKYLDSIGAHYKELSDEALIEIVAKLLLEKNVIGLFRGRMEFGPRALGNRSIIADPRPPEMREIINTKVKLREGFRPFAPAIIADKVTDWFNFDGQSPYMLLTTHVKESRRSLIPAVTHVDNSVRLQTVTKENNPFFYRLLGAFESLTGIPILVNTSFNTRGEPIVCTPEDAYACFMRTNLDYLAIENFLLDKKEQEHIKNSTLLRINFEPD